MLFSTFDLRSKLKIGGADVVSYTSQSAALLSLKMGILA